MSDLDASDVDTREATTGEKAPRSESMDPVESPPRVVFTQRAYEALREHACETLELEVCGILVGELAVEDGQLTLRVHAIIAGAAADEGRIQVTFTQETWDTVFEILESQFPDLEIVGWYHTHPGYGVEFSDLDLFVQESFFGIGSCIAFLTDPLSDAVAICIGGEGRHRLLDRFWIEKREVRCVVSSTGSAVSGLLLESPETVAELDRRLEELVDWHEETHGDWIEGLDRRDPGALDPRQFLIRPVRSSKPRSFPPVTPTLYDPSPAVADVFGVPEESRRVLELAWAPLGWWRMLRGRDLTFDQRICRLLHFHRRALEAELRRQYERADVFWRAIFRILSRLRKTSQAVPISFSDDGLFWRIDDSRADSPIFAGRSWLFDRLLREVLVDTHCAFYNGELLAGRVGLSSRAFDHFGYLRRLLALGIVPERELVGLLGPPGTLRVLLLEQAGQERKAERLCRSLLKQCRGLAELAANLSRRESSVLFRKLEGWSAHRWKRRRLGLLDRGIRKLIAARAHQPDNRWICEALARSHTLRARDLRRTRRWDEALVEARKAGIYRGLVSSEGRDSGRVVGEAADSKHRTKVEPGTEPLGRPPCLYPWHEVVRGRFPWLTWWFATAGRWTRVLVVGALLLGTVTLGLSWRELHNRAVRDSHYLSFTAALEVQDDPSVLSAAEGFLGRPIRGTDPRDSKVRRAYEEAFLRWFVESAELETAEATEQIERFRRLSGTWQEEDGE